MAISDHGATIASRTGRTSALKSATRMTANAAAARLSIDIPGMIAAVTANEIVATTSVSTPRFTSDQGPPRQPQIRRACVA